MKKLKIISSFIIIACITLTGCEKDNVLAPTGTKSQSLKNKSIDNKDGDGYWDDLQEFAYYLTETPLNIVDMDAEKAILYTESVLDYTLVNKNAEITKHEIGNFDTSFDYTITSDNIMNNEQIIEMYAEIKDEIINGLANTSFQEDDTIAISLIDLEYTIDEVNSKAQISINVVYGLSMVIPITVTCTTAFNVDVKAGVDEYCSGLASGFDAVDYINEYVDLACSFNNQMSCHEPDFLSANLTLIKSIYETSCNDATFYGAESTCIYDYDSQAIFSDIKDSWNQNCGNVWQGGHLNVVDVVHHAGLPNNFTGFDVYYQSAVCVQMCPNPCPVPQGNPDCYDKYGQHKPCAQ